MRLAVRPDGVARGPDAMAVQRPGGMAVRRAGAALVGILIGISATSCGGDSGAGAERAPAGNAETVHGRHASPPAAAPLRDGEYFKTLTLPAAYTPRAPEGGTDEYRCFILDTDLAASSFLTGTQFLPQNPEIVHHAILFQVDPDNVERARQHDRDTPDEGWPCFGNAGLAGGEGRADDAAWIGSWAPGSNETLLAPDLGYPVPAAGLLVIQIHYNLLATEGRPGGSDRSSIRLRLNDATAGKRPLSTELLLAPVELPCVPGESGPLCDRANAVADANRRLGMDASRIIDAVQLMCGSGRPPAPGNTQRCDRPVTAPATIHALGAHMHLLGRSLTIELNPGSDRARTLLDVAEYNFDDQALRPLPDPVTVAPGDTLRVTCTHDAALRQQLPQLRKTPPRYVVWGEGTTDEMCLGLVIQTPST